MRARRTAGGGFSLLELLIVLAVISLVASLAIPTFFERPEVTLEAAVRLLAEDLRAAEDRAAALEVEVRVRFDEDGLGYAVLGPDGQPLEAPMGGAFQRRWDRDATFAGVHLVRIDLAGGNELRCLPGGRVASGGALLLGFGEAVRGVVVRAPDGRVELPGRSGAVH